MIWIECVKVRKGIRIYFWFYNLQPYKIINHGKNKKLLCFCPFQKNLLQIHNRHSSHSQWSSWLSAADLWIFHWQTPALCFSCLLVILLCDTNPGSGYCVVVASHSFKVRYANIHYGFSDFKQCPVSVLCVNAVSLILSLWVFLNVFSESTCAVWDGLVTLRGTFPVTLYKCSYKINHKNWLRNNWVSTAVK